uniref:ATP synthase subunit a n=1 Tax=Discolomatidae sp. 4 ACP-2013 TaxID=1434487 RepID=A0A3G3FWJ5_9CUCU|nr:ATP synthase F0 subunit 6 [Discolomatidae sp. 4 ACP-2013]
MMNLFSSFDPSTNFNMSINWISTILGFMIISPLYWLIPSRLSILMINISKILSKETKTLMNIYSLPLIFIALFWLILFNNFIGLFSYIFTSTSHLILTMSLSLPLWLSFMFYGWIIKTNHMFSHLIPNGTPSILMPFMVCIESISNIIRPMTLAVRLTANMIAGHLLLTLLGNAGSSLSMMMISILIIFQILLLLLELAVSFIQSYVFMILSILYCSEIN